MNALALSCWLSLNLSLTQLVPVNEAVGGMTFAPGFREEKYFVENSPKIFYLTATEGNGLVSRSGRWVEPEAIAEMVRQKTCPPWIAICPSKGKLSDETIARIKEQLKGVPTVGGTVVFYRELYWEAKLKSAR